ncbi:MAG: penicillin-binding protein activator LpoB [Prevotellaceae bacterium]|nr:penicillin-binding protein activator LpoB [Prevotellaceae bacterium]
MKILYLALLVTLALGTTQVFAQDGSDEKEIIAIDLFSCPATSDIFSPAEREAYCKALRNNVMAGIHESKRVQSLDVESDGALSDEAKGRKSGKASYLELITRGAKYALSGTLDNFTVNKRVNDDKSVTYTGSVSYTLKLISLPEGTTVATEQIKESTMAIFGPTGKTPQELMTKLVEESKSSMETFVNNNFKLQGTIVQIESVKKDKAETAYIDLGERRGIVKGQYFNVYVEVEIAGETSRKLIGRLKAKEVMSATRTLCDVTKGEKEVLKASKEGQKLIIVTDNVRIL